MFIALSLYPDAWDADVIASYLDHSNKANTSWRWNHKKEAGSLDDFLKQSQPAKLRFTSFQGYKASKTKLL